jgi:hypothetical protein
VPIPQKFVILCGAKDVAMERHATSFPAQFGKKLYVLPTEKPLVQGREQPIVS